MKPIGQTIKEARLRKGLTQPQLAERAGMSVDWVRKVEYGRTVRPHIDALLSTARALDIPPAQLIPGYEEVDDIAVEYIPKDQVDSLNASMRALRKLSPERLKAAEQFLETFARMDDEEFQNQ